MTTYRLTITNHITGEILTKDYLFEDEMLSDLHLLLFATKGTEVEVDFTEIPLSKSTYGSVWDEMDEVADDFFGYTDDLFAK